MGWSKETAHRCIFKATDSDFVLTAAGYVDKRGVFVKVEIFKWVKKRNWDRIKLIFRKQMMTWMCSDSFMDVLTLPLTLIMALSTFYTT